MGLLDRIRRLLGRRESTGDWHRAEAILEMTGGLGTMKRDLGYEPLPAAALCFGEHDSHEFAGAVSDVRGVLAATERETGTRTTFRDDDHGFRWAVFEDDDPQDLLSNVHFTADALVQEGFGDRLLAAVFGFEKTGERAYWIYSFEHGGWYPFAPTGGDDRETATEFRLQGVLGSELTLEDDKGNWYPLWPSEPGGHPWE